LGLFKEKKGDLNYFVKMHDGNVWENYSKT